MAVSFSEIMKFSPLSSDQIELQRRFIEQSLPSDPDMDVGPVSIFLQQEGITQEDLESDIETTITIATNFLLDYANSTTEEHQKELSERFIKKFSFVDLNQKLKKFPKVFSVIGRDLLKLMNFQENRLITINLDQKARNYVRNIKVILNKDFIEKKDSKKTDFFKKKVLDAYDIKEDDGEISIFLKNEGITPQDLESNIETTIKIGKIFLLNYTNSTTEEHQKELSEKFIKKFSFIDLNQNLKKFPNIFSVIASDLLKLMNFKENREITINQDVKAREYVKKIKVILNKRLIKKFDGKKTNFYKKNILDTGDIKNDDGEISIFLKNEGITSQDLKSDIKTTINVGSRFLLNYASTTTNEHREMLNKKIIEKFNNSSKKLPILFSVKVIDLLNLMNFHENRTITLRQILKATKYVHRVKKILNKDSIIERSDPEDANEEISFFLQNHGITRKDLESEVAITTTVGIKFLMNYASTTTDEHQKLLSKKFINRFRFSDLNKNLKKLPHVFTVNIVDLLKLMNFEENRKITEKQFLKATRYVKTIKTILNNEVKKRKLDDYLSSQNTSGEGSDTDSEKIIPSSVVKKRKLDDYLPDKNCSDDETETDSDSK